MFLIVKPACFTPYTYKSIITDIEDVSDSMLLPSTCPNPCNFPLTTHVPFLSINFSPAHFENHPLQLISPKVPPLYPQSSRKAAKRKGETLLLPPLFPSLSLVVFLFFLLSLFAAKIVLWFSVPLISQFYFG